MRKLLLVAWSLMGSFGAAASEHTVADKDLVATYVKASHYAFESDLKAPKTLSEELFLWARADASMQVLSARTAAAHRMDRALAAKLVPLVLRWNLADSGEDAGNGRTTLDALEYLAASHPSEWLVQEEDARAIEQLADCDAQRLDALVARWPDADGAYARLARFSGCQRVFTTPTGRHPDRTQSYLLLAGKDRLLDNPDYDLAVLRVADRMAHADATVDPQARADVRLRRLRMELAQIRLHVALKLLPGDGSEDFRALLEAATPYDRLGIAQAFALTGNPQAARRWRALAWEAHQQGLAKAAAHTKREIEPDAFGNEDMVLGMTLGEKPADPFDVLAMRFDQSFGGPGQEGYETLWVDVEARVAMSLGYPGLARVNVDTPEEQAKVLESALADCGAECARSIVEEIRNVAAEAPDVVVSLPADPPALASSLNVAARPAWELRPMPPALRRTHRVAAPHREDDLGSMFGPSDKSSVPPWARRLPRGELVRYQQQGRRIVAITASQSLDPVGEVSSGGYWVSESDDGGSSFKPPLYTGMQVFEPYVILPDSKLPLLDGDALQPEVAVRELDRKRVSFPPIDVPIKHRQDDVFLRIPLADLHRDSDGDGLTDLAEQAMFLDPHARDTDRDGIDDAHDPMPQVPHSQAPDERAMALAAALNQILGKSLGAIVTTAAHSGGEPSQGYALGSGTDTHNEAGAEFLVGPAGYFKGIDVQHRVVVLTPAQAEQVETIRGSFMPIEISVFEINREATEGVLVWSAHWTGESLRLRKVNGKWTAEAKGGWIT